MKLLLKSWVLGKVAFLKKQHSLLYVLFWLHLNFGDNQEDFD